jgi:hypothetical protein
MGGELFPFCTVDRIRRRMHGVKNRLSLLFVILVD